MTSEIGYGKVFANFLLFLSMQSLGVTLKWLLWKHFYNKRLDTEKLTQRISTQHKIITLIGFNYLLS